MLIEKQDIEKAKEKLGDNNAFIIAELLELDNFGIIYIIFVRRIQVIKWRYDGCYCQVTIRNSLQKKICICSAGRI